MYACISGVFVLLFFSLSTGATYIMNLSMSTSGSLSKPPDLSTFLPNLFVRLLYEIHFFLVTVLNSSLILISFKYILSRCYFFLHESRFLDFFIFIALLSTTVRKIFVYNKRFCTCLCLLLGKGVVENCQRH